MQHFAAIDIGTNSVRLLVVDQQGSELVREMSITRLGQGVDQTGALDPVAIERTLAVLREYQQQLQQLGVDKLRMTATSAARDASNRDIFFSPVDGLFGQPPELLSGEEEAKLSFSGAISALEQGPGPVVVFDIGGGSTEFAFGKTVPERFLSLNVGGVRMTERFLHGDPPTPAELASAASFISDQLEKVHQLLADATPARWIGLAGTVTTFASRALNLDRYDPARTHGSHLSADAIERVYLELCSIPVCDRRKLLLQPKRAEVIVGGAVVLSSIVKTFKLSEIIVSEADILDGLAASLLPKADA